MRGGLAAAAASTATYLLAALAGWIVLSGFSLAVTPVDLLEAGVGALIAGWMGAFLAIPLIRYLAAQLPGLAALGAYALPGAALLAAAFIWVARARIAIAIGWGDAERPWELSDLHSVLAREEQVWALAFAAVMFALLVAIPLWLRIWLRLSPRSGVPAAEVSAQESDLLGYHDRVRATRVEAGALRQLPRAAVPAFADRDDITVVERNRRRRVPTWLVATAGANSILGKPAVVLFLGCLLLRAFLSDPGLERFPSDDRAVFFLEGAQVVRTLTVPLGPAVVGARLFALSGSGAVEVQVPQIFEREAATFSFQRPEESDRVPQYDVDLSGPDPGRGEIVVRSLGPGTLRLELRMRQRFSDGDLAVSMVLAIANSLLIVAGAVLVVLGITNLRSYMAR